MGETTPDRSGHEFSRVLEDVSSVLDRVLSEHQAELKAVEVGTIKYVGYGIVRATGLPGVKAEEILRFPGGRLGLAFNADKKETGIVLLCGSEGLGSEDDIERTGRVLEVPVGEGLLGRVVDATAAPLSGEAPIQSGQNRPVEQPAPAIMDRAPVTVPLQTGLKLIDALIPIGRGQRELIVGDRQTGKTTIAVDTIINQKNADVVCIYCGIGKGGSAMAKVIAEFRENDCMDYTITMVTTEDDPPGMQFIAPYAATSVGEYFMAKGRDVLVVLDDLTRHARAYRELSLLLRRPPGREAFPGDIFYVHSRLLERATHLRRGLGGGSLTALPIVETEAQNISAYIPTNLISITDGQIYLSPDLFQKGVLPAVDVGRSVSRVGGKTQLAAYRAVAGDLRLSYSQFEELESFSRFGTRLDEKTKQKLERGRRVREVLKQAQHDSMRVAEQIAALVAVNRGLLDEVAVDEVLRVEKEIRHRVTGELPEICDAIEQGDKLEGEQLDRIVKVIERVVENFSE